MTRGLVILASLIVILAGLKAASSLVVPFLLAAFLVILFAPPFLTMERYGAPKAVALLVMALVVGTVGVLSVVILRGSLDDFVTNLPTYEARLQVRLDSLSAWLGAVIVVTAWERDRPGREFRELLITELLPALEGK